METLAVRPSSDLRGRGYECVGCRVWVISWKICFRGNFGLNWQRGQVFTWSLNRPPLSKSWFILALRDFKTGLDGYRINSSSNSNPFLLPLRLFTYRYTFIIIRILHYPIRHLETQPRNHVHISVSKLRSLPSFLGNRILQTARSCNATKVILYPRAVVSHLMNANWTSSGGQIKSYLSSPRRNLTG